MYRNITVPTTASLQNDLKVVSFSEAATCGSSTLRENALGAASATNEDQNCHHHLNTVVVIYQLYQKKIITMRFQEWKFCGMLVNCENSENYVP